MILDRSRYHILYLLLKLVMTSTVQGEHSEKSFALLKMLTPHIIFCISILCSVGLIIELYLFFSFYVVSFQMSLMN